MESTVENLIARITAILCSVRTALDERRAPALTFASRRTTPPTPYTVSFPGRNENEAERFSVLTRLLSIIHYLLATGQLVSKRDVFYQYFPEIESQWKIDNAIDDIAATLGVSRSVLGIVAAVKGLVKGGIEITMVDGEVVGGIAHRPGLIPAKRQMECVELHKEVEWILLVEKEAIFQRLEFGEKAVVVTGKGYPDVATRELLVTLSDMGAPVFALVDLDPYGIEILATVRFGSQAMAHEGPALCVGGVRWLGVSFEDVDGVIRAGGGGLKELKEMDRRKAVSLLKRWWIEEAQSWKAILQKMLFWGYKAEIEILGEEVEEWVGRRILDL